MAQLQQQGKSWVCGMGELLSMRVDVANDRLHLDGYLKDSVYAKGMLIGQTTFSSGFSQVLLEACTWGRPGTVEYMINHFSDHLHIDDPITCQQLIVTKHSTREAPTNSTRTCLQAALRGPHEKSEAWYLETTDTASRVKVIQLIIAAGAKLDGDLLNLVIKRGVETMPAIVCLVENGVNMNSQDCSGWTPLMTVALTKRERAMYSNEEITSTLLELGADPYITNSQGYTAMHIAAVVDNPSVLQALLSHGVDPLFSKEITCNGIASPLYLSSVNYFVQGLRGSCTTLLLENQACLSSMKANVLRMEAMFHFIDKSCSLRTFATLVKKAKYLEDGNDCVHMTDDDNILASRAAMECLTVTIQCLGYHHEATAYARLIMANWLITKDHLSEVDTEAFESLLSISVSRSTLSKSKYCQEFLLKKHQLHSQAVSAGITLAQTLVKRMPFDCQQHLMLEFIKSAIAAVLYQYVHHSHLLTRKSNLPAELIETFMLLYSHGKAAEPIFSSLFENEVAGIELLHMVLFEMQSKFDRKRRTISVIQLFEMLLQYGGFRHVNKPSRTGSRLIHIAVMNLPPYHDAKLRLLSLLLKFGAHADAVDASGKTAASLCSHSHVNSFLTLEEGIPLPLVCLACRSVVKHSLSYQSLHLPQAIKKLISYHQPPSTKRYTVYTEGKATYNEV